MGKALSEDAVMQYATEGYYSPIDILSAEDVIRFRTALEEYEAGSGGPINGPIRSKSHLLFPWVDDIIRHPKILDPVEDLVGPNILCWNSVWWIKEVNSDSFVSWHQDARYWGLNTDELVTVWLALSPARIENGCMHVAPKTHRGEMLPHQDNYHDHNMLTRGQEIISGIDKRTVVPMELNSGQISLHNVKLAHASGPNQGTDRRIGLSIHYIPTNARQLAVEWDTATLVRGEDHFKHFSLTPKTLEMFDPEAVKLHERATHATREIVFKDADRVRKII